MAVAAGFMTTNLTGSPAAAADNPGASRRRKQANLLGYSAIPLGYGDEVSPPWLQRRAFIPWGTPILGSFPAFVPGANTAAQQEQQVGMHHDGMHYFAGGSGSARQ